MEQFVKSLFDRLDQNKQTQLFVIMQGAIDEMHNNGVIAMVDAMGPNKLHDEDPNVRVTQKTLLAKSIGKGFISAATQTVMPNGIIVYTTPVNYDPRFRRSICLTIQGGLEGLHLSGITKSNKLIYNVIATSQGNDMAPFGQLISQLDSFYEDIIVRLITDSDDKDRPEVNEEVQTTKKRIPSVTSRLAYAKNYSSLVKEFSEDAKAAYDAAVEKAKTEVISYASLYRECFKEELDISKWKMLTEEEQFEHVLKLGNFGVTQQFIICADFVDYIPYCDALALFIKAHKEPKEKRKQIVDAGDGAKKTAFKEALESLKICDPDWDCTVY